MCKQILVPSKMKETFFTIAILVFVVTMIETIKLPSYFKKCDKRKSDFNNCLSSAIHNALKTMGSSLPEYDLPCMDPFILPMVMEKGNSQNGIYERYNDLRIHGFTRPSKTNASYDFDKNVLHIEVTFPKLTFEADFYILGSLILLPINNSGVNVSTYTSNSTPPLSCDFEKDDICGWNHDLNHDFDWTRLNFRTPSWTIGTGPSYDHTKGKDQDGYYMYIESSARNVNDTARLISPVYGKTDDTTCFEFYYHMYGATTGSLRVYLKKTNQNWKLDAKDALFVKSGNQGNRWHRGFMVLESSDSDFQVVIEGVRGSSYVSDIAIDDVRIIEKCNPDDEMVEPETTTEEYATSESIAIESCENRCEKLDSRTSDWLMTCDCDEGCYERNRCCPDYFDYCVTSTNAEEQTTEVTEEATTLPPANVKPTTVKPPTVEPTTVKPTTKNATVKIHPRLTLPPIAKKTKPTTAAAPQKDKESDVVEITTVFVPPERETPFPVKEVERVSVGGDDKNFDHQKIEIGSGVVEANTRTIVFAVGVIFGVLFAMVGMAFVAKRYQWCRCRRMRRNQSGSGDSQSDVRFLTGDEVLDFTLASDYDTL